jgi:hypothetical protein
MKTLSEFREELNDVLSLDEARIKVIRARVRGGKIQRKKKVSNVKGYTLRGGKLTRMSSKERMDRKRGARKAKTKIRAKAARAAVKRRRSMRKRASIGL